MNEQIKKISQIDKLSTDFLQLDGKVVFATENKMQVSACWGTGRVWVFLPRSGYKGQPLWGKLDIYNTGENFHAHNSNESLEFVESLQSERNRFVTLGKLFFFFGSQLPLQNQGVERKSTFPKAVLWNTSFFRYKYSQ